MGKIYNLARMTTATTGTGTITLGAAVSGYLTFVLAGAANGDVVSYGIKDGANSEVGTGTYTTSGTTLTRTVTKSTNANAAISLSGAAEVFITPRAEDLTVTTAAVKSDQQTGTSTILAVTPSQAQSHDSAAKAWAYLTQSSGTYTLQASYNCSVAKNSTGNLTVTFTTPFASANYAFIPALNEITTNSQIESSLGSRTASAVVVDMRSGSGGINFDSGFSFVAYGRQ